MTAGTMGSHVLFLSLRPGFFPRYKVRRKGRESC
jgi:hypothetical protein